MIHARVHQGRIEVQDPIPDEWEGQLVKILPMTPDDPSPGLEEWLAALHAMGPMEFEAGERQLMAGALAELDRVSKAAMQTIAGIQP
jgi:hypothetical protein